MQLLEDERNIKQKAKIHTCSPQPHAHDLIHQSCKMHAPAFLNTHTKEEIKAYLPNPTQHAHAHLNTRFILTHITMLPVHAQSNHILSSAF